MSDATASPDRPGPIRWAMRHRLGVMTTAAALVLGVPFVLDLLALEATFTQFEGSLTEIRTALASSDLKAAKAAATTAVTRADAAAGRVDGPVWWALAKVPRYGAAAEVGRAAGALAVAASRAAEVVTDGSEVLFDASGNLRVDIVDGHVDLEVLAAAGEILDRVPLADVHAAVQRLEATRSGWVPGAVHRQRQLALASAQDRLEDLETATLATDALPGFLGAHGKRRYLLGLENPSEIRATGGFLGFVGVLEAEDGRLRLAKAEDIDPLGDLGITDESFRRVLSVSNLGDAPVNAPADFAARYDGVAGRSWIPNVNTHPSLPTIAPIMLDIWERQVGERLDGMMLVDPITLEKVLEATGPLDVPDEWAHPDLPDPIPADALLPGAIMKAYDVFGGQTRERMNYHTTVATAAFAQMFGGDWQSGSMFRSLGDAAAGRHLMIASNDASEQELFTRLGADGFWGPTTDADLFLGVSANNASANKADLEMLWEIEIGVQLSQIDEDSKTALADIAVTVTMHNQLDPTGRDAYITHSWEPQALGTERVGSDEIGLNRTWFTVWTDEAAAPRGVFAGDTLLPVRRFTIEGMGAYDRVIEVGLGESDSFLVRTQQRVRLRPTNDGFEILLRWMPPTANTIFSTALAVGADDGWTADAATTLPLEPATVRVVGLRR